MKKLFVSALLLCGCLNLFAWTNNIGIGASVDILNVGDTKMDGKVEAKGVLASINYLGYADNKIGARLRVDAGKVHVDSFYDGFMFNTILGIGYGLIQTKKFYLGTFLDAGLQVLKAENTSPDVKLKSINFVIGPEVYLDYQFTKRFGIFADFIGAFTICNTDTDAKTETQSSGLINIYATSGNSSEMETTNKFTFQPMPAFGVNFRF